MREAILREAEVAHCGSGVTATDDGERASRGGVDQALGHGFGAGCECRNLEHAHRAVPHDGLGIHNLVVEELLGIRTDIQTHLVSRNSVGCHDFRSDVLVGLREDRVHHDVGRQHELDAVLFGTLDVALDGFDLILFQQGGADLEALGLEEGVDHAAADDQTVGLVKQVLDYAEFVGNLGTAKHDGQRALRFDGGAGQSLDFLLDQQAGGCRQISCNVVVGALRTVHDAETVGHECFTEGCDLLGVSGTLLRILAGFFRVVAHVLQQHDIAIVHCSDLGLSIFAVGVFSQRNLNAEQFAKTSGDRSEGQFRNDLALRAAEVGHQNDFCAFFAQGFDGRQGGLDTTVIGNRGAVQRNVEISANENALALEISKILECLHVYPFLAACKRGMAILPFTNNTSSNEQKHHAVRKQSWCFV